MNKRRFSLKSLFAKLMLSAASLVALFVTTEIALRLVGAQPRSATGLKTFFQPDADCGWRGRPNIAQRYTSSDFDVLITHDADGLRRSGLNLSIDEDTNSATTITWCVGDSFTWGTGVADDQTWVAQLNARSSPDHAYRNLGVAGFSTLQESFLLRHHLSLGRKPDVVLVMYCSNDPTDNLDAVRSKPYFAVADGQAELRNWPVPPSYGWNARAWLKRNLLVMNYGSYYLARAKQAIGKWRFSEQSESVAEARSANTNSDFTSAPAEQPATAPEIALRKAYQILKDLCQEHDVELMVAKFDEAEMLARVCNDLELPLIDLAPYFRQGATDLNDPLTFPYDGHWTETGNRIAADGLHRELEQLRIARSADVDRKLR